MTELETLKLTIAVINSAMLVGITVGFVLVFFGRR